MLIGTTIDHVDDLGGLQETKRKNFGSPSPAKNKFQEAFPRKIKLQKAFRRKNMNVRKNPQGKNSKCLTGKNASKFLLPEKNSKGLLQEKISFKTDL